MHSVDSTLLPLMIYPITSTSIGQFLLQAPHRVHSSPVGVFLMMEYRAGIFITRDCQQQEKFLACQIFPLPVENGVLY